MARKHATNLKTFLERAKTVRKALGLSESTLSRRLFTNTKRLSDYRSGVRRPLQNTVTVALAKLREMEKAGRRITRRHGTKRKG